MSKHDKPGFDIDNILKMKEKNPNQFDIVTPAIADERDNPPLAKERRKAQVLAQEARWQGNMEEYERQLQRMSDIEDEFIRQGGQGHSNPGFQIQLWKALRFKTMLDDRTAFKLLEDALKYKARTKIEQQKALTNMTVCLKDMGEFNMALAMNQQAFELLPDDGLVINALIIFYQMGDLDNARKLLRALPQICQFGEGSLAETHLLYDQEVKDIVSTFHDDFEEVIAPLLSKKPKEEKQGNEL